MNILASLRKQLMSSGQSEAEVLASGDAVKQMFDQIQTLRLEMNDAKKKAAEEAATPYVELIQQIEKRYALMIKLSSR